MLEAPQKIDLIYGLRRHWFEVWRYDTEPELHAALLAAGIKFEKDTIAYTDCFKKGDECGRMYLLDTSVKTLAHEAAHMANGILARHGYKELALTTGSASGLEEHFCDLVGQITSELYSRSKFY